MTYIEMKKEKKIKIKLLFYLRHEKKKIIKKKRIMLNRNQHLIQIHHLKSLIQLIRVRQYY